MTRETTSFERRTGSSTSWLTICRGNLRGALSLGLRAVGLSVAIAVALTAIFIPLQGGGPIGPIFGFNFLVSLVMFASGTLLFSIVFPAMLRLSRAPAVIVIAYLVSIVGTAALGAWGSLRIADLIWRSFYGPTFADVFQIGLVVCLVMTLGMQAYEGLQQRAAGLELDALRAERAATEARLEALRARTDPHFLFNSLNTVAGLVREDPRAAERALETLSELYRYVLDGTREDRVPLARELAAVDHYLTIEQLRFGDRLRIERDVDGSLGATPVPPLVLQPLVENAVVHGIGRRREGGTIRIAARRDGDDLALVIEDDGIGLGGSSHAGSGTSVEDLAERLALAYGGRAALQRETPSAGGHRVRLRLPLEGKG